MTDFATQVAGFMEKYQKRMRATMRESVQATVALAQQPAPKAGISQAALAKMIEVEGGAGRMRIDTGFLRASIGASVGQMPSGESVNPSPKTPGAFQYDGSSIAMALLKWQPGETLYVGWTANYARPREARDGFLRGAVEKWDGTVDRVAAKVRKGL